MRSNPYVGPRSYTRADQQNFYGRNRESRDLLSLILAEKAVLFYAPSGAGKTSLLQASILPALEEEGFNVLPPVRVSNDLPTSVDGSAVENIFVMSVLLALADETLPPQALIQYTLPTFLEEYVVASQDAFEVAPPLLIIDQGEELFTAHRHRWQDVAGFFCQLRDALRNLPTLGVVISMREDYIGELEPYAPLMPRRLRARFRMERLGPHNALQAISQPAQNAGIPFEKGVARQLVDDLRRIKVQCSRGDTADGYVLGPHIEPVQLQVVCQRLWDNLPEQVDERIQWDEVQQYGDVDRALIDFYEQALERTVAASGASERRLRRWIAQHLITPMQTRGLALRGAEETAGLPNAVIDALDVQHLVRSDVRAGARWYELVHDRLIQPILQSNRAWDAARQTPFHTTAKRWNETHDPALLYQNKALKEIQTWATAHTAELEPYEHEFLAASHQADRIRRRMETLRTLVITVSLVGLVITGLLTWIATRNGLQSYSREMAAAARYERNVDQTYSIQLARAGALPTLREWFQQSDQPLVGDIQTLDAQIALRQSLIDFYPLTLFDERNDQINALTYSPDGRFIYTALPDHGVWIYDLKLQKERRLVSPALNGVGAVWSVAASSEGRYLAVGGDDGNAREGGADSGGIVGIWDTQTNQWAARLQYPTPDYLYDEVQSVAFSPDGRYLAAGGDYDEIWRDYAGMESGLIRVWSLAQRGSALLATPVLTLTEPTARVKAVTFRMQPPLDATAVPTETFHYLAAASFDGVVRVWTLHPTAQAQVTATLALSLTGHTGPVYDVAFNPAHNTLASASEDKTVRFWDLESGAALATLSGHEAAVTSLAFSSDGRYLLTGSRDLTVRLWNADTPNANAIATLRGPENVVLSVAFSPDDQFLAAGAGDQTIRVWDRLYGRDLGLSTLSGHATRVRGIDHSPDGTFLASGDNAGQTRIWSLTNGTTIRTLPAVGDVMWALTYSPDGQTLVTCSQDDKARVWDPATGKSLAILTGHGDDVEGALFSPDGDFLITVADDHQAFVWDTATWKRHATLEIPSNLWSAATSPDERYLILGLGDGALHFTELQNAPAGDYTAAGTFSIKHHTRPIMGMDFSPDGQYLATASWDGSAQIWSMETLTTVIDGLIHPGYVYDVKFSSDGHYLATGARDGALRLWSLEKFPRKQPQLIGVLDGHSDLIWNISFSPDSKYLVSSSWDGTIRRYPVRFEDVLDLSRRYVPDDLIIAQPQEEDVE